MEVVHSVTQFKKKKTFTRLDYLTFHFVKLLYNLAKERPRLLNTSNPVQACLHIIIDIIVYAQHKCVWTSTLVACTSISHGSK